MIDPVIARWALDRVNSDPQLAMQVAAHVVRVRRETQRKGNSKRVLRAEPISLGTAVLALIGITGVSTAVAGIVGGAILIGASIAVNYAVSALTQKSRGSSTLDSNAGGEALLNAPAIKLNERQAVPAKRIIYGTAQVGGALFFEQVRPPYLYMGFLVCSEKITAFRKLWIGTQEIAFSAIVPNTILTPIAVTSQPDYPTRLRVSFRLGATDQAIDPLLAADFSNLDAEFRQRGIATAVLRFDYGADFDEYTALWGQGARPNPLFLVDGIAIPDPRNPAHILDWDPDDPASLEAARATWSFSNNAALVQAHYLTQRYGGRIRPSRLDWAKTEQSADWDDGLIASVDGTYRKRHTIDGVVTLRQSPATVMTGMISANRGLILQNAGRVWPSSSFPRAPIVTIHDGLLTGPVEYRASKPKADLVNRVKLRFVAADREYQEVDGPVLSRADLIASDGELLEATLDLPFTMDTGGVPRAQRLQKAFLDNARLGRQLSVTCDIALLADCADDLVGSAVVFDSGLFSQANGTYLCLDWSFADNFASVLLTLVEYGATIETDFVAATDEQAFELAPLDLS